MSKQRSIVIGADTYLRADLAAERLGMALVTMYRRCRAGVYDAYREGGRLWVREASLADGMVPVGPQGEEKPQRRRKGRASPAVLARLRARGHKV